MLTQPVTVTTNRLGLCLGLETKRCQDLLNFGKLLLSPLGSFETQLNELLLPLVKDLRLHLPLHFEFLPKKRGRGLSNLNRMQMPSQGCSTSPVKQADHEIETGEGALCER